MIHYFSNCTITENGGIITAVSEPEDKSGDLPFAIPGFIDCHMHGALGIDVATASTRELVKLARLLRAKGEAAFLPTIPAASPAQNLSALKNISEAMKETVEDDSAALIAGCHMEGPFLCPAYKGALDEKVFCDASPYKWMELTGPYESIVKRITVDPLRPGVIEMIPYFTEKGIQVSLGHSASDCDTANRAYGAGATSATHLFSAMSPLKHREPGMVGAALSNDEVTCELICDFLHVAPEAVRLSVKAKTPSRIAVITDSCQAAGMPDGEYVLGGRLIHVVKGEARMPEGQLASSTVFMKKELVNLVSLGFSLDDCAKMLSENPARLSGINDMGAIRPGMRFRVNAVNKRGELIRVY